MVKFFFYKLKEKKAQEREGYENYTNKPSDRFKH